METKEIIAKVIEEKLEEKIEEKIEKGIEAALSDLFGSYGDVTKVIKKKLEEVIIPHVERINYGDYVMKMDALIAEMLKNVAPDYKKMVNNFKEFTSDIGVESCTTIKLSEVFKKYNECVAIDVNTDDLEVDFDDDPQYASVETVLETESITTRFSSYQTHRIILSCPHDEKLTYEFEIWGDKDKKDLYLRILKDTDIKTISNLNKFDIYMLKLDKMCIHIELDETDIEDEVVPEERPEPTYY